MFCNECGTQNPETNRFCKNCGNPLPRRQAAVQPAVQPGVQMAAPVPPAAAPMAPVPQPVTAATPAPAPVAAPKRKRNWLGKLSLILGILSWGILTVIIAAAAVLLGIIATVLYRRATGRIGISNIIGILLGVAAIAAAIVLV